VTTRSYKTNSRRSPAVKSGGNAEVYERITNRIVDALERGEAPVWQKPWKAGTGRPRSMSTGKPYRGVNVILTAMTAMEEGYSSPFWATYRQIAEQGGQVRAGEHGTQILLFKDREVTELDPSTGEAVTKRIPLARAFAVFNACQADGLPEKYYPQPGQVVDEISEPQEVLDAYLREGPKLQYVAGDGAHYSPKADTITLPQRSQFRSAEQYYAVAFHEAGHSSGHQSRLNREGIADFDHFGTERYSREELVAQLSSAMLSAETGIANEELETNDVAYLQSWAQVLRDDPKMIVTAASQAQKAADLIMEPSLQAEPEPEREQAVAVADREAEAA
jgi:antirestriction protein ArdC